MLEGAVARILNQLLGKYVVDLDTENLNVGIFSGLVQLTDLKLKTEALYELRLPIQVRAGTIGKINLQIPWSSLWSQPVVITVEDILVLCKPIIGEPFDPEQNKRLLRGFKKQTLEAIASAFSMIGGPGLFSEHLLTNIVNNIQLSVSNIHIRYECYLGDVPTAVGLCIGAISAENTNSKWKACPMGYKSSDNLCYHLVKVEALCVYCNGDEPLPNWDFTTTHGYYTWKNAMANSLQNYSIEKEFNFCVRPMSIKLKMTITKDHGQVKKISSDCIVHDLNVHLDKKQCKLLLSLYDCLQRAYIAWDFLPIRPVEQPPAKTITKNNCKSWWNYAYNAVLQQRVYPYTWSQIKRTRQDRKSYSQLYQQHLLNPNDTELKLDLQQHEDKLNITNIIGARQEARLRVRTKSLQEKSFWDILPSPEKQLLCERIGFIDSGVAAIDYEYNFRIGNTCVALTNENDREVLVLTLTQIIGSYKPSNTDKNEKRTQGLTRKGKRRDKGAFKIEGIIIEGANEKEHLVPIISSNHEGHDSPAYFLRVDWESYPDSGKRILEEEIIQMRVNLVLEQLECIYDEFAYEQILLYLDKNYVSWGSCKSHIEKIPKILLDLMEKQLLSNWDFNVVLNFPYFVLPEKGQPLNSNGLPILIIDLGQLKLNTDLCRPSLIADNATQMELEEQMYSKFNIELRGQQVLFTLQEKDNWKAAKKERDTELHLLPKMRSTLVYCSCIKKIKTLAEHKINLNVQSFKVNLSEKKILNLLAFVKGFEHIVLHDTQITKTNKNVIESWSKDIYKGCLSIKALKRVQNSVTINDTFSRKRKERLRKQPSIIDKKIEHHTKNMNVNEAWARCVDLPGLEDNISPSNTIKIIWRLVLNELQISYSRSSDTTDTPYLNLRFGLITVDLALMTFGPAYQFSLGNIMLTDKMHTTPSGQYLDLLHSPFPSTVDVFAVLYRKVAANCPDYWTHFHGVETSLVADFGTLHVMLHQEAVRTLIQYGKYIKDKIMGSANACTAKIIKQLKMTVGTFNDQYFKTKVPVPSGSIKFSHSGRLGDINLRILDSDFDILNIHLQGLEADFLFRANERFVFRSFLSSIDVEHLSDVTLYRKVLHTDEDKVFELKYVRFSDITESEASSFKFHLGQLHITFLYKLIVQLHRFLLNLGVAEYFQRLMEKTHGSLDKATESLKTNTKINLSVNIKGPVFLVPQKSSSPNVLIIDTGNISIENFFKDTAADTIENILIKLNDIIVSRGVINMNGTLGNQETIVEPMAIHLDVKRFIPKSKSIKTLTWELDGLMEIINITLGQKDMTMLLAICSDMSEQSPQYHTFQILSQQTSIDDDSMRNLEVFFAEPKQKTLNVKFNCDGINILLFFDSGELLSSPIRDLNHGLSKLQINEVSICCVLYTDTSMDGKLSVDTVLIEELGPDSNSADSKILHSPLDENKNNNCMITVNKPPVIDITFHRNRTSDKSIDVIVGKLALTLSVPFIEKLALFVIECLPKEGEIYGVVNHGYVDLEGQQIQLVDEEALFPVKKIPARKSLTIALRINKPEFIFLVEGATGKRRFFVTKAEILLDYSRHSQRENFVLSLSGLHTMYASLSNESYTILKQCDVELSKAVTHEKGEKLSLSVSSLYLQFSNKVVYAINDVLNDIVEHFKVPELPDPVTEEGVDPSLEELWEPRKVVVNYGSQDNPEPNQIDCFFSKRKGSQLVNNHQVFLLPKTELIVLFELETLPVLVFKSTAEVTISDWSTLINANCDLTIQANYFNAGKQNWEPFIDPIVIEEKVFKPWDLNIKVFQDKAQDIAECKGVKPVASRNGRCSIGKSGRPKHSSDGSRTSEEDEDESGDDMVYLEPTNSFHGRNSRRVKTSLSTFLDDSDSENDDGSMEKLAAAISDLFTGDWNESDGSDIENSTDSDPDDVDAEENIKNQYSSRSLSKPFRKSLYLLIDCKDTLNITVTPALIKTLTDIVTLYSNKTLFIAPTNYSQTINLVNDIGPKSKVEIFEKEHLGTPASTISESDCKLLISKTYEKEDSCPNSPSKEAMTSLISDVDDEYEAKQIQEQEEINYDFATVNSLDFSVDSTTELYEKINKYQMKIFIPHFYGLQTCCPRKDAQKLLRLHPCQVSTSIYYLAYRSSIGKHGMSIALSSPLAIRNETCFALSILYQPSVLQQLNLEPVGDVTNPFETTMRIAVLEPHETYNVPIHIAYHCKLFIQPAYAEGQYVPSKKGIWWKDLASDLDTGKLLQCQAKNKEGDVFALRVVLDKNLEVDTLKHTVPNYIIRLLPAMIIKNFLPYAITVDLLVNDGKDLKERAVLSSAKIEPGEKSSYYNLDTSKDNKVVFRLQTYQHHSYTGSLTLTSHMDEKVIALVSDSEKTEVNNLPLNIKANREDYYELALYTSYWINNKTQLSVQLKATSTNTIYKSNPSPLANEDIILFSFKRHTRQTLKLKVYDSEFSNEFGLDCPGTTGLVVCKDTVRKKRYAILLKITLSEMCPMTKIVTLLPCFMVSNQSNKKLRFMEHNEKTDLWIDIQPGQELPFWPETTSYQMYVKLQEQKVGNSQSFFFAQRHKTLLKLSLPGALTVNVTGGIDTSFKVTFSNYKEGDAPLLIKNTCQELFLKIQQQNLTGVTLLSPQNEILYTWDDPCKNRLLVWNIYNNKASNGFVLDVEKSVLMERYQYGQERINFGNGTATVSSSEDSDSDSVTASKASSKRSKEKLKDRLTIYWLIYIDSVNNQRCLLFTQDHVLFGEYLQKCFAETVDYEVLLSLSGLGVSVFTNKVKHRHKEHLYLSLNDCPATWEVNVGHKWKTLTLELASWIEDKYKSNQKRCQLKDYVHIDFEKMFMLKPFFAELRRSYNPAVYFQYRRSPNSSYVNLKLQNVQIDNKTLNNQEAIILSQLGGVADLTKENTPFIHFSLLKSGSLVKSIDLAIKDCQLQLQSQLLEDMDSFFKSKSSSYQFRKDMSRILNNKTKKLGKPKKQPVTVEQLKCSSTSILLHVQAAQGHSPRNKASTSVTRCQGFFFPANMTPYMPSEGVKHKIVNLELVQLQCKSMNNVFKFIWGHFKTQFLQQYYAQVLGLQVLVNPHAIQQTINPQVTGHIQDVSVLSGNLLYSLRCLLGHVNMSSAAVEQCILEMLSGQHNFVRRPTTYQLIHQSMPKIVNWSLRHFNPGVILALSQIIAAKSASGNGNGQSDGELFFRGTGKALVSLLTRHPDDKSNSVHVATEALKRASLLGEPIRCHQRLTRYSNKYLGLGPFSIYESMGCHLLETVAAGRFKDDTYWMHSGIDKTGRSIVIITLEHALRVNKCRLWGLWELEWSLDLDEIISVPRVSNSRLVFNIRQETDRHKDDDLAANSQGKLSIEGDEEALVFLQQKIEQAIIVSMEDKAWTIN